MEEEKTVAKPSKPIVDLSTLNKDQAAAFEILRNFIHDKKDDSIFVLKGWAGTGKTYCVSILVRYVLDVIYPDKNWYKIAVTGPTNKSVRVIKKTTGLKNPRVSFQTIHRLLGLTEKITQDGQQEFVNKGDFVPQIQKTKLLIIDEVSMLNDELFYEILRYRDRVKIICMGDPAQIPPVGKPDCIPFREEFYSDFGIKTVDLKKIMRQKGDNPIIDTSVIIRNNLEDPYLDTGRESLLNPNGEGIEFLNLNSVATRDNFTDILSKYFNSDRFKDDSEYSKMIAWRNKTVETMNNLVRKVIYGDESLGSKILVGEKLIANNPIIEMNQILFNTNDEFTVEDFKIKKEKVKVEGEEATLKYYEAGVGFLDDDDKKVVYYIDILHEDSESYFNVLGNKLKKVAIEKRGKEKSWIKYYDFIRRFADVSYAYAITAHKSQGSTYETAFVLEDDIDVNINVVERNRIKYTAYTRSSKKLYVVKRF
jgi:ATP-dependent exoDNAse (exonuclease V) alpha subunit